MAHPNPRFIPDEPLTIIRIVRERGMMLGIEFEQDGETFFIANRQDLWEGIRVGSFPNQADGKVYERVVVKVD